MKKKLSKFFIIMVAICLALITLSITQVQGATQSNPNTHYQTKYVPTTWMTNFREMETIGGALGLSEKIDETTMLATPESSNNLDSHMIKSTEYGAIAILSASGYGNSTILQESTIKSTTGNETGVYFSGRAEDWEWVAGGLEGYIFTGVDGRYYDTYGEDNTSAKVGDALGTADTTNPGCTGWHLTGYRGWFSSSSPYISRDYGGLFAYTSHVSSTAYNARGVIICGEGL